MQKTEVCFEPSFSSACPFLCEGSPSTCSLWCWSLCCRQDSKASLPRCSRAGTQCFHPVFQSFLLYSTLCQQCACPWLSEPLAGVGVRSDLRSPVQQARTSLGSAWFWGLTLVMGTWVHTSSTLNTSGVWQCSLQTPYLNHNHDYLYLWFDLLKIDILQINFL